MPKAGNWGDRMVIESPKSDGQKRDKRKCRYYIDKVCKNQNCINYACKCTDSAHCSHYDAPEFGVPVVVVPKNKIPPHAPKEPNPVAPVKMSDTKEEALNKAIRTPGTILNFYLGGTVTVVEYNDNTVWLRKPNGTVTPMGIEYCIKKRLVFL